MYIDTLIYDLKRTTENLGQELTTYQRNHNILVNGLVKMHQEARVAKDYKTSDSLRNILSSAGVIVIQGTAGYAYDEIPERLKGRFVDDTWRIK